MPINPPDATASDRFELPAYVSNGVIGLRLLEQPLTGGVCMLSGFAGEDPERHIEGAARAPLPIMAALAVDGLFSSDAPHLLAEPRQSYDFAAGELVSRAVFQTGGAAAEIEVLTFCSRARPTLACQEVRVRVDKSCVLELVAGVDARGVYGRDRRLLSPELAGEATQIDGGMLWESLGGVSTCGMAFVTEVLGADDAERQVQRREQRSEVHYKFRARPGQTYRLRQMTSVVVCEAHGQPDLQAARLAAMARRDGFEQVRAENAAVWQELWKSRIRLVGASAEWQGLADAAMFYLNTSCHASSLASTSIFGLAAWPNYHYYYGHVMWDIETFVVPPLALLQPHAAAAMLAFRRRHLAAAHTNATLFGRRGLEFPWEAAPSTGQEAAPLPGTASWHEDHVSLDVARAFSLFADITGDRGFLREQATPVLAGVAQWIESRVTRTDRGYEILRSMGIAERSEPSDNTAFTNLAAKVVLDAAIRQCEAAGAPWNTRWAEIAEGLVLPMRGEAVISHDRYRVNEDKAATPDPLMGIFPLGYEQPEGQVRATLGFYLTMADEYLGSPMLSALYGVWAARAGDRRQALRLLEEGYGKFVTARFRQTLEYRTDRFPEQPMAGPFFANIGGFLMSLILGFPHLQPDGGPPEGWVRCPTVLPDGWKAIEIDRLWIRGRPMRLVAPHGERARLSET
jgi:trehalose/maltose hydrolase-like predicted phosphorylase